MPSDPEISGRADEPRPVVEEDATACTELSQGPGSIDKPLIVVIEADPSSALASELGTRYSSSYRILTETIERGRDRLRDLADSHVEVALIMVELSLAATGVLDVARTAHPHARRGLLLNWHESRSSREEVAAAFADRRAEWFVTRPSGSPDERFHRTVTELLDEWWRVRGGTPGSVRIVGDETSPRIHEMRDALQRHDIRYSFYSAESELGQATLASVGAVGDRLPVVIVQNARVLVDPSNTELAGALGARTRAGTGVYDVVVVGGGPAGLSAAVCATSEGLRTALIEPTAMGGQAGTSSMIRNYLGFPRGISGAELASRALEQAILFGTEMVYGASATSLRSVGDLLGVELSDGHEVRGRTVVIATGVSYRMLDIPTLERFNGVGVFYGAAMSEAPFLTGKDVFVVGGGNSAGQAAVYLARFARRVTILVRADSLADSMSNYLITELQAHGNIEIRYGTEVVGGDGDARLEVLDIRCRRSGIVDSVPAAALFVLIGARPFTEWLPSSVSRDEWGYVITGSNELAEQRLQFESTLARVFAVGDVRRGSVKRVASAAGEGAVGIRLIHDCLARLAARDPQPVTAGR